MSIREELASELREAMRSGDTARRDVIRQIESEVAVAKTAPGFRGDVDDDLYRRVIVSYSKKMAKAVEEYRALGERGNSMAERLSCEVEYLRRWVPSTLGEDETRQMVRDLISELGVAGDPTAAGRVIGTLMKRGGEGLEGALVNRIAREELSTG